jgi:hypothetical protein
MQADASPNSNHSRSRTIAEEKTKAERFGSATLVNESHHLTIARVPAAHLEVDSPHGLMSFSTFDR